MELVASIFFWWVVGSYLVVKTVITILNTVTAFDKGLKGKKCLSTYPAVILPVSPTANLIPTANAQITATTPQTS
jgi:hypothetical protein